MSGGGEPWTDALERLTSFPMVSSTAKDILPRWREGYFHLDAVKQTTTGSKPANANPTLLSDGSNLTDVLHDMRSNREDAWRELQGLIQEFVPSVGTLTLPATGNQLDIAFQHGSGADTFSHTLKNLGTGVEQLLMTLVVGLTQSATTIVLEEPEGSLHPAGQRAVLGLLQKWSEDRLILAATHSPTMLDWSSLSTTILSVSRKGSESAVTRVPSKRSEALLMLQELGVRASDVLVADRILVLEGPTEMEIFNHWFPDYMRSPRLSVLSGTGGYNARHADLFASWLTEIDKMGSRKVLCIRDQDEMSASFLAKLAESRHVAVLPCREFENLLLDFDAIAAAINAEILARGGAPLASEAVAAKAREVAQELVQVVILKRTMADFADPLRFVDHKLRGKFGKPEVQISDLAQAMVDRLPDPVQLRADIEAAGEHHSQDIQSAWDEDWALVTPGFELLKGIYMAFLGRGYDKLADGQVVAQKMDAPKYLRDIMKDFMSD